MTERDISSIGAPCWVDTFQPDAADARDFYAALFGWDFDEPFRLPTGHEHEYFAARRNGRLVAGIGQTPTNGPAGGSGVWRTYIRVADLDEAITRVTSTGGTRQSDPLPVGDHGRLAAIADPTGVWVWLWEAGVRRHAELVNEPGSWAMSALHTTNLASSRDFYGAVFGWHLDTPSGAPFSYWRLDSQVVAVAAITDGATVPPHWSVNFAVQDVDVLAEQAAALDGRVLMAPFDSPGFRNTVIADPHGGVVAASAHTPRVVTNRYRVGGGRQGDGRTRPRHP